MAQHDLKAHSERPRIRKPLELKVPFIRVSITDDTTHPRGLEDKANPTNNTARGMRCTMQCSVGERAAVVAMTGAGGLLDGLEIPLPSLGKS